MSSTPPLAIDHFSDILCIWAYVADARMSELAAQFGGRVTVTWRCLSVFGNVPGKMTAAWGARGGMPAYAAHVREIASAHPHVRLHADAWLRHVPQSSLPAHLVLCALRTAETEQAVPGGTQCEFARRLRAAFFGAGEDIGARPVLQALLEAARIAQHEVDTRIADGRAYAALAEDLQLAKDLDVRASPTLLFNEGRQRLAGNVGYRIIQANVRELLEHPQAGHSWC